ncbi:hypothetical protein C8E03_110106 [Lachnotalea glycerini]|uniref:Uncharacterized protein n=1 Tax=Lachnotalea glycerini TaxID=1763509 RepID=A0A318EJ17_9FIRM|nr:hypothetical protein [Lachnotalea glycerini]PXV87345.1 hypothetical protein C8E03_110106 [Lachnotalea glycerini]
MKKILKKAVSITLAICLTFSAGSTSQAFSNVTNDTNYYLENLSNQFDTMTAEELNQYIGDNIQELENQNSQSLNQIPCNKSTSTKVSAIWLAGAKYMEKKGNTCTAKLLEYSVLGKNYTETQISPNGLFAKKIVTSSAFTSYLKKVKNNKAPAGIAFEKSDNADLFYALHYTDASTKVNFAGTVLATYNVTITDTFDFSLSTDDYKDIITTSANNYAWFSQNTGALNVIDVKISFTK